MSRLPESIEKLIEEFAHLPTIGYKTAERVVFYLIEQPEERLKHFGNLLLKIKKNITFCQICQNPAATNPCEICSSSKRNKSIICVVAKPQDVIAIEKTNSYLGTYHVLSGILNPLAGIKLENLKIAPLIGRIKNNNIAEIILALNPDIEGETTNLALIKIIKNQNAKIKITRLARGLPMGSDLEYADEVTLSNALTGRREV